MLLNPHLTPAPCVAHLSTLAPTVAPLTPDVGNLIPPFCVILAVSGVSPLYCNVHLCKSTLGFQRNILHTTPFLHSQESERCAVTPLYVQQGGLHLTRSVTLEESVMYRATLSSFLRILPTY